LVIMNERKPFPLRLDPTTLDALKTWAAEDLRSLNGQIEYLLRAALREAGRLPAKMRRDRADADDEPDGSLPEPSTGEAPSRTAAPREPASTGPSAR
jgi:hypothetical protein